MSYTPVVRWRNFQVEHVKTILELFPDMLTKMSRKEVVDEIETKLPGYTATAYQFACQAGLEARKEHFTPQNYLYALDDAGLEQYLSFWFKMYVCPNPYVRSNEAPICPFQVIARKVLNSPDHKISFNEFFTESFGEGKSTDIFKNALIAWGKPLRLNDDEISVAPEDIDALKAILEKVERTLPMKNNKDIDEFFERFSCEKFIAFYDLATIDNLNDFELPNRSLVAKTEISEEDFRDWLSKKVKNDGQPLSTTYQNAYYYILKAIPSMLGFESVFSITDPVVFKQYRQRVEVSTQYQETNPNLGVGILSSALTNYGKYLEERNMLNIPAERLAQILKDWYANKYVENNITSTLVGFGFKYARPISNANISSKALLDAAKIESTMAAYIDRGKDLYAAIEKANIGITMAPILSKTPDSTIEFFDYAATKGDAMNMILFGTPGCGKSYHIEHDILGKDKDTKEYIGDFLKENIIRTTFYQDYSYTDFVGQILPKIVKGTNGEKDTVEYIFNPGPFTLALIQAISNPTKKVALVVEEINRGNAPAIFGDIFQLLDRDENNISEYGIVNVSMIDYLNDYPFVVDGAKKSYKFAEIKIPGNLYIYATMNTSDQNVYTLDTAFVRRWDREKIKNTFANCTFRGKNVPGMDCTWQKFVEDINACIASHLEDLQVNEDKQIGAFFVKESLLSGSAEKFAYKVFDYLWNDVAKLDHGIFFNHYDTLDALIAAYVEKGAAVFKPGVLKEKAATPIQSEATDE